MDEKELFDSDTIENLSESIKITKKQRIAVKEWIKMLNDGQLEKEVRNYFKFADTVLSEVLEYEIKKLEHEGDDNVEFQISKNNKMILNIELKGASTKDLFARQSRKNQQHTTPINQLWDGMGKTETVKYGICSNYNTFILISKVVGYGQYHKIDFTDLVDDKKIKEFIYLFSKKTILNGNVEKCRKESLAHQEKFSSDVYSLYHNTRLMIINEFDHTMNDRKNSIRNAQLFLNRMIFMMFASDKNLIAKNFITDHLGNKIENEKLQKDTHKIFDMINDFRKYFDEGASAFNITQFNGMLFKKEIKDVSFSDLSDLYSKDDCEMGKLPPGMRSMLKDIDVLKKHPDLNPIIRNILILDKFDFDSEINVNILGHIFEQSLDDIPGILSKENDSKHNSNRKKDGIFYTPEYITAYISRNTIIPYLSKSGTNSVHKLVAEYEGCLNELESKLSSVKILDPACGSGAFLIAAADILLKIQNEINLSKPKDTQTASKIDDEWVEQSLVEEIISNNIFGVDINEESVEITKLSLYLRTAQPNKVLKKFENIKGGNSLISEQRIDRDAFSWGGSFPDICGDGKPGFDIIIGNPPYGAKLSKKEQSYLTRSYKIGSSDTAQLMIAKAYDMLRDDGYHGFIVPKALIYNSNWSNIRNKISNELKILVDVGKVWKEVKLEQVIYILKKNPRTSYMNGVRIGEYINANTEIPKQNSIGFNFFLSGIDNAELELGKKILNSSQRLGSMITNVRGADYQRLKVDDGTLRMIAGRNCQPFTIRGEYGLMGEVDHNDDHANIRPNSILTQNLVAHISNPRPHIQIIASPAPAVEETVILDTVNQICSSSDKITSKYILGLLSSNVINWYAYRFIYGKAIRTMHFDNPVTDKIPVRIDKVDDVNIIVDALIILHKELQNMMDKNYTILQNKFKVMEPSYSLINLDNLKYDKFCKLVKKQNGRIAQKSIKTDQKIQFNKMCKNIKDIKTRIVEEKERLDEIFYGIFELDDDEKTIIKDDFIDSS